MYGRVMSENINVEKHRVKNDVQWSMDLVKIDDSVRATIRDMDRRMEEEVRRLRVEVGTGKLEDDFGKCLKEQNTYLQGKLGRGKVERMVEVGEEDGEVDLGARR